MTLAAVFLALIVYLTDPAISCWQSDAVREVFGQKELPTNTAATKAYVEELTATRNRLNMDVEVIPCPDYILDRHPGLDLPAWAFSRNETPVTLRKDVLYDQLSCLLHLHYVSRLNAHIVGNKMHDANITKWIKSTTSLYSGGRETARLTRFYPVVEPFPPIEGRFRWVRTINYKDDREGIDMSETVTFAGERNLVLLRQLDMGTGLLNAAIEPLAKAEKNAIEGRIRVWQPNAKPPTPVPSDDGPGDFGPNDP